MGMIGHRLFFSVLACLLFEICSSQNGGDRVGPLGAVYERLYRADKGKFPSLYTSKALGVYNRSQTPKALLEVNSTPSYYGPPHPALSSKGELFRTEAPADLTANWRFFQGGDEIGRFWSSANSPHLNFRSPNGELRLWSSDTDPAAFQIESMRVWGTDDKGGVSVHEHAAVKAMPRIALLNVGSYVGKGQRSWMENGLFSGFASDGLYLGMKAESGDHNDAVLNWNDNAASQYRDHLRFIFTQTVKAGTDASGEHGLEVGRFDPGNGYERNEPGAHKMNSGLGVGNFYVANGPDEPVTTRLDILNGDLRVRDLPYRKDPESKLVVVVRPNGVLRVRKASSLLGDLALAPEADSCRKKRLDSLEEKIRKMEEELQALSGKGSQKEYAKKREGSFTEKSDRAAKALLFQNRPNPFRETTVISYRLPEKSKVELLIRDQNGVPLARLIDRVQKAGLHHFRWKPSDLSPGLYFYSLKVKGREKVLKAIKLD